MHFTSLKTAVAAHLSAAEVLLAGAASGQAIFVADGAPLPLWQVVGKLAELRRGHRPPIVRISYATAWKVARVAEWCHVPFHWWPPIINRYRVAMLGRSHWFDLSGMRATLGLEPRSALAAIRVLFKAAQMHQPSLTRHIVPEGQLPPG